MKHTVQAGESLWRIAQSVCGDARQWRALARANDLANPDLLLVGQTLYIPEELMRRGATPIGIGAVQGLTGAPRGADIAGGIDGPLPDTPALIPSTSYVFVLADEIDPTRPKVVRRVLVNPTMAAEAGRALGRPLPIAVNPERFGFAPTDAARKLSIGRHAMGMKPSPFISASQGVLGARRFTGSPFWIDIDKARAAGATIHETGEILADLDRIAGKTASSADRQKIEAVKRLVMADREVLLRGPVPASAVKGGGAMAFTRGMQGVQIVGFAMTAVNVGNAAEKSIRTGSARPIAAEAVRQAGGWAAAWAGMKLGAAGGALVGIGTGPGALATGAIGSVVGGVAGYFGFDWIADHIDENE